MNHRQIQYFLSVAKYLSFSKAAEAHYTSQPSISRQIALLERELGFQLFIRNKHNVQLTPSGWILFEEFGALYEKAAAAVEKARQMGISCAGRLNIGYLQETNIEILIPLIKRFTRSFPEVEVAFEGYGFKTLREKLFSGGLDIAFMLSFELTNVPYIAQREIFSTTAHMVISASHPLAARADLTISDCKDECLIVAAETDSGSHFCLSQFLNAGFSPKKIIRSATSESIIMYVESQSGVAIMDPSNRFYRDPKFRFVAIEGEGARMSFNAAWRKDNQNPAIALFDSVISRLPGEEERSVMGQLAIGR